MKRGAERRRPFAFRQMCLYCSGVPGSCPPAPSATKASPDSTIGHDQTTDLPQTVAESGEDAVEG